MKKQKRKYSRRDDGVALAEALRRQPSLSAFSFDGPYDAHALDLLDNAYCLSNGRYYETPVDWYGLARASRQTSWHQSALYFKRNGGFHGVLVLLKCGCQTCGGFGV